MKKALAVLLLAGSLAGCASISNTYDTLTGSAVSPMAVIIAGNAFDGVEATATNYLRLPNCLKLTGPICRTTTATNAIIPAVRSGRAARNALESFMMANPGKLGPTGLYNALKAATATLQQVFAQYGVK